MVIKEKIYNDSDLSVVVHGRIESNLTKQCLESIHKFLPKAEIILSTWENSNISDLEGLYNTLILNKDPEATIFDDLEKKYNNLNRILVSAQSGINAASKKYILRLRSDLVLKNNNVLKLTDHFRIRISEKSLFKKRIFAYCIFSIKYDEKKQIKQRMLFHISDWCHFGLKEDLQELFNVPKVIEPEFSRYFEFHKKEVNDVHFSRIWKMSPEQYITFENAKKILKNLNFENYLDINNENISLSEDFIINNFIVYSSQQWGIYPLKKQYKNIRMNIKNPITYYSNFEQLKDYKKYCDNSVKLFNIEWLEMVYENKFYNSLRKHFFSLIYCKPSRKFSEIFSTLFYLHKFLWTFFMCKIKS